MATDLFDIHIKISKTNSGEYCAKTILGNNAMLFERFNPHLTDSICDLMVDLDVAGIWTMLEATPSLSGWPFTRVPAAVPTSKPATKPTTTTPAAPKKKQVPVTLQRPVDLTSVHFPDCKPVCQAYDLFGRSKCKALCQSKKGI